MDDIFFFATNDINLKIIFINTYAEGGNGALIETIFSKRDSQRIFDVIKKNQGSSRDKPEFGNNPRKYFYRLIEHEKQLVESLLDK